jgi:hypothetical protein
MIQGEAWYMIRQLLREGVSVSGIARRTGHDRKTIRKIRDAAGHPSGQERRKRGSKLDPYKPYLRRRAAAGVLNAVKLLGELRRQGYPGGITVLREFLHDLRPAIPIVTELFRDAVIANAPNVILAHNHPSGDPTPSPDDVKLTKDAAQAAEILSIDLLDHVIIGDGRFVSLKEQGVM